MEKTAESATRVQELLDIAVRGLHRMFDQSTGLFCDRLVRNGDEWQRVGVSERYSLMCYLGLHEAEKAGVSTGFDPVKLTRGIAKDLKWLTNVGDLGCLLWAVADVAPEILAETWSRLKVASALDHYPDGRVGATMEVALFVTGLAKASSRGLNLTGLQNALDSSIQRLLKNRGASGLFGHMSRKSGLDGFFRGYVGSFADQVYPTIALATTSKALGRKDLLNFAQETARKVCSLQGTLGQWWWHYNSENGEVLSTYPVYSVHQHAMGPMMLFAVMDAGGEDFSAHIRKGLQWVDTNELGMTMCEASAPLVWRSVAQSEIAKWNTRLTATVSPGSATRVAQGKLSLVPECRPYELGWLLYAFSSRAENRELK